MDRDFLKGILKKWPVLGGFFAGVASCHFYYKELRLDEVAVKHAAEKQVLESRLETCELRAQGLEKKLSEQEDYKQKFVAESSRAQTLDRKYNDLVIDKDALARRFADLNSMKWEEQFNAEKLSRISTQEEAALLKKRLVNAESAAPSANPELLKQLSILQDQLAILSKERDEQRKLYVTGSDDVTNCNAKIIRLVDYEKKRILLESRRTDDLERVFALRGQLIETVSAYLQVELLRLQKQKWSSDAQAFKCLEPLLINLMKIFGLINNLYNGWVFEIYRENEAIFAKGLSSSIEDYQTIIGKKSPTIKNAERIVTSIAGIDKIKGNLLQGVVDTIEPQMLLIGGPK